MRTKRLIRTTALLIGATVISTADIGAYERYSQNDDNTWCRECHGDFRNSDYVSLVDGLPWGNLHNVHRSTMLGGDCDACHIGSSRLPVYLNRSTGDADTGPDTDLQ